MSKVFDKYKSMSEFETVLDDAKMSAANDWEEEFVKKAEGNYTQYGMGMFWSEEQDKVLRRIAGPDDY